MNVYDIYAPWYDAQNAIEDVEFYLDAVAEYGGPVLDPGCGTGRLLIPLACEGHSVTGFDISHEMMKLARHKISLETPAVQQRIHMVYADMKYFSLPQTFGVAIFGCNTFQHLLSNQDQDMVLQAIHRHLKPDGRLFIQGTNVQFHEHEPDVLYYRGRDYFKDTGQWVDVSYSFHYEPHMQIQQFKMLLDVVNEHNQLTRQQIVLTLRYFFPPELERILAANGFALEAVYGDFHRNPLTRDSQWVIAQARKVN